MGFLSYAFSVDAIVTENLTKTYPGKMALNGLNFVVKSNTIHGFLGPNGAGKSTTMNILSCLMRQTGGRAYILGKETLQNALWVKERLGFLPEIPPLYGEMKVGDFLLFCAKLYGLEGKEANHAVVSVVEKMHLSQVKNRLIDHLSKGYKQRVGIASALIFNPPVLILDEPAAGLDPKSIKETRELISSLREEHTVMLSSHHLDEVGQICDDITIVKDGELVLSDSFEQVQRQFSRKKPLEIEVAGGDAAIAGALEGFSDFQIIPSTDDGVKQIVVPNAGDRQQRAMVCRKLVERGVEVF